MSDVARSIPRVVGPSPSGKEGRNARFRRLATRRVQEALKKLDRIGDLATPKPAYSEEEAARIIAALRERVDAVERRLLPKSPEFNFE